MNNDDKEAISLIRQALGLLSGQERSVVPESWLSAPELANLIGKDPSTVRRWITERGLPGKEFPNGNYHVRYRDFLDWQPGSETQGLSKKKRIEHGARDVLRRIS